MEHKAANYDSGSIRSKIQSGDLKIISKRSRSNVWNMFSRVSDLDGNEISHVICKMCPSVFRYHGSTSNLVRHKCYKDSIHGMQLNESRERKAGRLTLNDTNASSEDLESSTDAIDPLEDQKFEIFGIEDTKDRVTQALSDWILEDCRPLSICQDSGLKKLAALFINIGATFGENVNVEELLTPPIPLWSNIESYFGNAIDKVQCDVSPAKENGYSLTSDCWKDSVLNNTYLLLNIHFVINGALLNRLLTVVCLDDEVDKTSEITFKIDRTLMDFQLDIHGDKPIIVATADSNIAQVQCINSLLNNIVEKTFNEVSELKDMLCKANKFVKDVTKLATFSEFQMVHFMPGKWNSIYHMLSSIEKYWHRIVNMCTAEQSRYFESCINIETISSVVCILSHFEKCASTLQNKTYPTLHLVIPHIHRLKKICSSQPSPDVESRLKQSLKGYLETVVQSSISKYHKMAMYLFPPTNQLLQCTQEEKNQTIEECKTWMKRLCPSPNVVNEVEVKQEFEDDLFSDFLHTHSTEDSVQKEIRRYSDIQVALGESHDILNWWYMNRDNFPLLYRVSCRVLATPATTDPSPVGQARRLHSEFNLSWGSQNDMANKILFVHNNLFKKCIM